MILFNLKMFNKNVFYSIIQNLMNIHFFLGLILMNSLQLMGNEKGKDQCSQYTDGAMTCEMTN